ncbi:MAG: class I SAM-dependent methyltransferase [Verrucomicrobiota bacterium]
MKGVLRRILRRWVGTVNTMRYSVEWPRVEEALGKIGPVGRMLDGGAGSGEYSRRVIDGGWAKEVVCYEPYPPNYAILEETLGSYDGRAVLRHEGIEALSEEDGSMDAVMCCQVLEHIERDEAVAKEFARVLKEGGHALICVPRPPAPWPEDDHVREGYTEEALDELFVPLGMERVHTDWFLTRGTQERILAMMERTDKGVPTLLGGAPREVTQSAEARRAETPYGLLGLYRKRGGS